MDLLIGFLLLILLVVLIPLAPIALAVGWRTQRMLWGKTYPDSGLINGLAHKWFNKLEKTRAKRVLYSSPQPASKSRDNIPDRSAAEVDARKRESRRARLELQDESTVADFRNYGSDADGRLEKAFASFTRRQMTFVDYRAIVEDEVEAARERRAQLRDDKADMHPDLYEFEMEEAEHDLEAAEWRLRWIEDREYKDQFKREGFAESGKWARFEYVDQHGEITDRSITNWEQRGAYIVGWDRDRKAERTFRQDRIGNWVAG